MITIGPHDIFRYDFLREDSFTHSQVYNLEFNFLYMAKNISNHLKSVRKQNVPKRCIQTFTFNLFYFGFLGTLLQFPTWHNFQTVAADLNMLIIGTHIHYKNVLGFDILMYNVPHVHSVYGSCKPTPNVIGYSKRYLLFLIQLQSHKGNYLTDNRR